VALSNADVKEQSKAENGGIVLSSRIMQPKGMKKPICIFHALTVDGSEEIVHRFSLVHKDEKEDLTAQFIDIEKMPEYEKVKAAEKALQKVLDEQEKAEAEKLKAEDKKAIEKDKKENSDSNKKTATEDSEKKDADKKKDEPVKEGFSLFGKK
jgi:hypothetical protein